MLIKPHSGSVNLQVGSLGSVSQVGESRGSGLLGFPGEDSLQYSLVFGQN